MNGWMVSAVVNGVLVLVLVAILLYRDHTDAARIHEAWRTALDALANMQRHGSPNAPPPVTVSREIDAEERVQRMVSEATIQRGVDQLRAIYTGQGLQVPTDEELRSEALSMIGGSEPMIETAVLPRD